MGGLMTVMGLAGQAASLVSPYFERNSAYRIEEKRLEAEAVKTRMRIDNELRKAEEEEGRARAAEREARLTGNEARISAAEAMEAAYREMGNSRAGLAGRGILHGATGAAILADEESEAARERLKIESEAGRRARGLLSQAEAYRNRAGYVRQNAAQSAKIARLSGEAPASSRSLNIINGLQTAGSILGTVSSVYRLFR